MRLGDEPTSAWVSAVAADATCVACAAVDNADGTRPASFWDTASAACQSTTPPCAAGSVEVRGITDNPPATSACQFVFFHAVLLQLVVAWLLARACLGEGGIASFRLNVQRLFSTANSGTFHAAIRWPHQRQPATANASSAPHPAPQECTRVLPVPAIHSASVRYATQAAVVAAVAPLRRSAPHATTQHGCTSPPVSTFVPQGLAPSSRHESVLVPAATPKGVTEAAFPGACGLWRHQIALFAAPATRPAPSATASPPSRARPAREHRYQRNHPATICNHPAYAPTRGIVNTPKIRERHTKLSCGDRLICCCHVLNLRRAIDCQEQPSTFC